MSPTKDQITTTEVDLEVIGEMPLAAVVVVSEENAEAEHEGVLEEI